MSTIYIPEGYQSPLDEYDTQRAIVYIKDTFQQELSKALNLKRVSAPLFVMEASGLNDNLNGVERPVSFDIPALGGAEAQVVHSLAKWKRFALKQYDFRVGNGLYTDMNAIRRDEELDNVHSIYVDQWDWEKVITRENRNPEFLKLIVVAIVHAICNTADRVKVHYPQINIDLSREVSFVTTQELEDQYPDLESHQREDAYVREHPTACIMKIGGALKSGKPHDGRAPDYDDWELNGDIILYNPVLDCAFEISSMGIRVDEASLASQLAKAGCRERARLPFQKMLLEGKLPQTIGGGIGQSRLCMLLLKRAHVGEVLASWWPQEMRDQCEAHNIHLL